MSLDMTVSVAACRTYRLGTAASLGVYVASIALLSWSGSRPVGAWLWPAALVPSLAIAAQLWVTLRFMRQQDEFMRAVMAKRFIAAATLAFIVATTWGFLETYARVPHLPGWLVYPTFWAGFALVSPFVRTSH